MTEENKTQDAQDTSVENPEVEEAKVTVTLSDAKQALLNIRIVSSELDSGITNVNRGNPMLARALREKLGRMRGEFETLDYFLAARSNMEEENGEVQQEEQGSSEETPSAPEGTAPEGNAPDSNGDSTKQDDRPMTAAEKIAVRKKEQQGGTS